jgi:hypothetical protein
MPLLCPYGLTRFENQVNKQLHNVWQISLGEAEHEVANGTAY